MPDSPPARARLAAVPAPTATPPLPPETAPVPETAPSLLAALDAGDEAAVRRWVRGHTPEPQSLVLYGLLAAAGITGFMEWPAVVVAALGQVVIDRRFGGVERLAAELRTRMEALPGPA